MSSGFNLVDNKKSIIDVLHIISSQLNTAIYGRLIVWVDTILGDIFEQARHNDFLPHWIKAHAPETEYYAYELWSGSDDKVTGTTLIPKNHKQKDYFLDGCEVLVKTLFTMNEEKAKEIKKAFLAGQDTEIDARNAAKKGVKKLKK